MKSEKRSVKGKMTILVIIFFVILIVSNLVGDYRVELGDFFRIIGSALLNDLKNVLSALGLSTKWLPEIPVTWSEAAATVLLNVRLPRIGAALVVGASLSVAGICYQGLFRNPMVSPNILGADTGAGFGAALAILLGGSYFAISVSAFIFGLSAVLIAWGTSRLGKSEETLSLILSGIIVSSLFSAGTSYIKLVADTQQQLPAITYWLMGSLSSIKVRDLQFVCIPFVIGIVPLILLRWRLNLLTVEEQSARTMGINLPLLRFIVILCATLLTASSVAVSGIVGWVGLVIPHFCRMIFGYDYRKLIPVSVIFGAAFLSLVDDLARTLTTGEIPLGILTAFVGAPLFMYLLITGGGRRD